MKTTRVLLALAGAALLGGTAGAKAAYPDRPIHYVLHVSPGGATDVMARKIGSVLQKMLHEPVVVENRPGGRGASEMAVLTTARPDGYTVGAVTSSHIAEFHQTLRRYNIGSISWIARMVSEPYLFVVRADSGITSMKGLAAALRKDAGKMVVSGFIRGSGANIAWEMFMKAAGLPSTDARWVPYNSVGRGVTAILGGHGVATVAYYGLVKDQVAAGKLRILGVMAPKRLALLPNVPTVIEQGFAVPPEWDQWRGIIGPKNIPPALQAKFAADVKAALDSPEMQSFIKHDSLVYDYAGPAAFTAFAKRQDVLTAAWLKKLGFTK